jgi:ABC-type Na+ efflux pump permease subunit
MSDETISPESIRFLIEQKVSYINAVVHISMLWWASSIVFSGSVLAAVWSQRDQVKGEPGFVHGLGIVLFVFFFVIAYFGHIVAVRVGSVQREIADAARHLHFEDPALRDGFFQTERRTFQISMWLGAGSFALIWIVWIVFWMWLSGHPILITLWTLAWVCVWLCVREAKQLP